MSVGFPIANNSTSSRHQLKTLGNVNPYEHSSVEDVAINIGLPSSGAARELIYSIPWRDRAIVELNRMKIDAYDEATAGAVVATGAAIGAGIVTLLTLGAPDQKGLEGVIIETGVSMGTGCGIGAGLGTGFRGGVLTGAGVAGIVAGGIVAQGIDSTAEVLTGAILATGAATVAAVAGGVFMSVLTGVIARRNWPY